MNAKTLIGGAAVLVLAAAAAIVFYLNRPAAEEASIANALGALDGGETGSATAEPPPALEDASGEWTVSTEIGTFDFADASSTFVGFRVAEELRTIGQTEAVGRTPEVTGRLTIDGSVLTAATITADFTTLQSDIPRRDNAMKRAMGVAHHPTATFTLSAPVDFGAVPEEGQTITFTAAGDLTVNGLTNPVEVPMEGQVADGNLLVVGSAPVVFEDFGITAPQAGPVVSIADNGTIEVQVWFVPA